MPLQQRYNSRAAALYRDKVKQLNLFKRINVSHIRQNRESIVIVQKINFEFFCKYPFWFSPKHKQLVFITFMALSKWPALVSKSLKTYLTKFNQSMIQSSFTELKSNIA